jgi:hypothetical protein
MALARRSDVKASRAHAARRTPAPGVASPAPSRPGESLQALTRFGLPHVLPHGPTDALWHPQDWLNHGLSVVLPAACCTCCPSVSLTQGRSSHVARLPNGTSSLHQTLCDAWVAVRSSRAPSDEPPPRHAVPLRGQQLGPNRPSAALSTSRTDCMCAEKTPLCQYRLNPRCADVPWLVTPPLAVGMRRTAGSLFPLLRHPPSLTSQVMNTARRRRPTHR